MRSKFKWIFTLLVAFTVQFSFAQQKTVTGTVSDELGPVVGANVVIKGTTTGTTTDFNGNYSIQAKQGDVLEISFVGMTNQEVTVGAANQYNVTLTEGVLLDDLVITALGIKRKEDEIVGSYDVVKTEELTQASAPTVAQALVGKVSGLNIQTTSSGVNNDTRITLNGMRSITGNNEALVVIDNAVSTATVMNSLPPDAIESVNVIKGAQGAVLYGKAGSNGVIIVTTKRGTKDEKLTVNINSSLDFQEVSYLPVRQTRYGQGWYGINYAVENGSWGPEFTGEVVPVGLPQADGSYIMAPYKGDSDNIKKFFQTGTIAQHNVSFSAGSLENGYINLSLGRQDRDFVIKDDELGRTNVGLRAGKKVGKFTIEGGGQYYSTRTRTSSANQANGSAGIYALLLQTATNIPVEKFENSGINGHWNVYYRNPYWIRDNIRANQVDDFFFGNLSLKYDINKNINVVWNPSVQLSTQGRSNYVNAFGTGSSPEEDLYSSYSVRSIVSSFSDRTFLRRNLYSDVLVNFDYKLSDNFGLAANVGNNLQARYFKINNVGGSQLDTYGAFYNYENVLSPSLASSLSNYYTNYKEFALFANVDLKFKDYLVLNIAGRNDWSGLLHEDNNSYFYPGAGLSFIATKAFPSLKSNTLNYAKLYLSYTGTGNTGPVGPYDIDAVGSVAAGFPYGDLSSYVVNQNPTFTYIKPERNYTKELGLSLGFFNDRLTFDGQYYYTTTEDMITNATASSASGLNTAVLNVGQLYNTGINLDLGFKAIKPAEEGDFGWSGKVNFSTYKTVVEEVAPGIDEVNILDGTAINGASVGIFAVKGEEFPTLKGVGYQRDDQGRIILNPLNGNPLYTSEYINYGKTTPDYIVGFTNAFTYKGVTLTAVCDYRTGGKIYSGVMGQLAWTGNLIESAQNGRAGGFIMPNSSYDSDGDGVYEANTTLVTGGNSYASFQNYFGNDYNNNNVENNILDATALKVREISLSYALPSRFLNNTGISALSFGLNARNVFMWLPKENKYYADPESSYTADADTYGNGLGYSVAGQYPPTRTYGFSLNLTF